MFAPYCPTCQTAVLLGSRRIVRFESSHGRLRVMLRCHCGKVLRWDEPAPPRPAAARRPAC